MSEGDGDTEIDTGSGGVHFGKGSNVRIEGDVVEGNQQKVQINLSGKQEEVEEPGEVIEGEFRDVTPKEDKVEGAETSAKTVPELPGGEEVGSSNSMKTKGLEHEREKRPTRDELIQQYAEENFPGVKAAMTYIGGSSKGVDKSSDSNK